MYSTNTFIVWGYCHKCGATIYKENGLHERPIHKTCRCDKPILAQYMTTVEKVS